MITKLNVFKEDQRWLDWLDRRWQITLTLGILAIAPLARIVRAQTLSLREREFVLAARSLGARTGRILWREILPNLVPTMLTVAFTGLGILIAAEGGLAFLGLSVETPTPTWGKLIDLNRDDRRGLVGDGVPVPDAVPDGALVQPHRRLVRPSLRHPRGDDLMPGRQTVRVGTETGTLLEVTDLQDPLPDAPRPRPGGRRGQLHARAWAARSASSASPARARRCSPARSWACSAARAWSADGSIRFEGQELIGLSAKQMRHIWGQEMAMIFQDPMSSLNPLMKIGEQIAEPLRVHLDMNAKTATRDGRAAAARRPHPRGGATPRAVPARDVGRHAPAGDDRHRPRLRPDAAVRRRADDRPRRHRAGADPRPDRRAAPRPQHVGDPRHPRPRRRRRPHRRDRRDVRRQAGREGADRDAVRQHEDAVHRGAAARASRSSRSRSHTRLRTIPGRPPDLVNPPQGCRFAPRCAVRPRPLPRRRSRRSSPADTPDHLYACWYPVGSPEYHERRKRARQARTLVTVGLARRSS